jgi:hypothetical protein
MALDQTCRGCRLIVPDIDRAPTAIKGWDVIAKAILPSSGECLNLAYAVESPRQATASLQVQHFHSPHVRAGHYHLKELASDVRHFINQLTAGIVKTPTGPLHFFPAPGGRYATSFIPFHPRCRESEWEGLMPTWCRRRSRPPAQAARMCWPSK